MEELSFFPRSLLQNSAAILSAEESFDEAEYFAMQIDSVLASGPRDFALFDALPLRRPFCPFVGCFSVADRPAYVMSRKIWSAVNASTPNIK